jgi:signal transduction histidine kinase
VENWEPSTKPAEPGFPTAPLPSPLGLPQAVSHEFNEPCDILSCALKPSPHCDISSGQPVIPKGLLHQLLRAYPQGQVLNLEDAVEEDYLTYSSTGNFNTMSDSTDFTNLTKRVSQHLPGAKSAIFLPLWDWNKSRWLTGVLAWTKSSFRALGLEELHYFNVFGDSIISEVSRIHWASDERSKFDFISSVSHELRSPLHGILASAELLNGTSLDGVQKEMVNMIERSGLTLLDTTNHM